MTGACLQFYNHLFGCPRCIGRRSDFCPTGRELWSAYDTPLTAAGIVREQSLHRRRYLMSLVPEWQAEAVRAEVRRLWDQRNITAEVTR